MEKGTGFGFQFSVFGFRFSVFGFRCVVFGVRCSVSPESRSDGMMKPQTSVWGTRPPIITSRGATTGVCQVCCLFVIGRSCKLARLVFLSLGLQPTLELIRLKDSHSRSHPIMSFAA